MILYFLQSTERRFGVFVFSGLSRYNYSTVDMKSSISSQ